LEPVQDDGGASPFFDEMAWQLARMGLHERADVRHEVVAAGLTLAWWFGLARITTPSPVANVASSVSGSY